MGIIFQVLLLFVGFSYQIGSTISDGLYKFGNFPMIQSIAYHDHEIKHLRNEITENMTLNSKKKKIRLKWRLYKIKKGDQFFQIMAKTMQNPDTISSINRLSSVWDLESGDVWWIPNMRGIAQYGIKKELAKKYRVTLENIIRIPFSKSSGKKFYFIMGITFRPEERSYFGLVIFERPVQGVVSSQYGMRKDPFSKKYRFHKGIDIACKINSKIWAAANGRVIFTGYLLGYGKSIIIEHQNGYQSLYGHLNRIIVQKKSLVAKKSLIAYSGNSGRSTGPHLHFEIRRKGKVQKPRLIH